MGDGKHQRAEPMKTRKLLFSVTIDDCRVDTFCSGGPGGQHQNKTRSGVRITHLKSGAVGESREMRSQHQNKQRAFGRMAKTPEFRRWARLEAARRANTKSIDEVVAEMMTPDKLRVEVRDESGKWAPESPGS